MEGIVMQMNVCPLGMGRRVLTENMKLEGEIRGAGPVKLADK